MREFCRRHVTHGRVVSTLHRRQEIADGRPMQRGDGMRSAKSRKGRRRSSSSRTCLRASGSSPSHLFVTTTSARSPLQDQSQQADVLFRDAFVRIKHCHHDLCFLDCLQGLDDTEFLDCLMDTGTPANTSRVDQDVFAAIALEGHGDAVAGRSGSSKTTKRSSPSRRFASVDLPTLGGRRWRCEAHPPSRRVRSGIGQVPNPRGLRPSAPTPGRRAPRRSPPGRRAPADGSRWRRCRVLAFGLVDDEPGPACMPSREFGCMLVRRSHAFAPVHEDDGDIGFLERPHGLFDHHFPDALLAAGDAAGIDDQVGYGVRACRSRTGGRASGRDSRRRWRRATA